MAEFATLLQSFSGTDYILAIIVGAVYLISLHMKREHKKVVSVSHVDNGLDLIRAKINSVNNSISNREIIENDLCRSKIVRHSVKLLLKSIEFNIIESSKLKERDIDIGDLHKIISDVYEKWYKDCEDIKIPPIVIRRLGIFNNMHYKMLSESMVLSQHVNPDKNFMVDMFFITTASLISNYEDNVINQLKELNGDLSGYQFMDCVCN